MMHVEIHRQNTDLIMGWAWKKKPHDSDNGQFGSDMLCDFSHIIPDIWISMIRLKAWY